MKANRATTRKFIGQSALGTVLLVMLASCAPPQDHPEHFKTPTPALVESPPAPGKIPAFNWRDAPITPGIWRWSGDGGNSVARFGSDPAMPQLALRCVRATRAITIERSGVASGTGPVNMTISTSTMTRPMVAEPGAASLVAALVARDSLLDAIAFSRGRFAIEAEGLDPLYVPSWPEMSRVIEDCR